MRENKKREYQIGPFWIGQEINGNYNIYWYEKKKRRTKRKSLGHSDFQQAKKDLTLHHLKYIQPDEEDSLTVRQISFKYYEEHGKDIISEENCRIALDRLNNFLNSIDDGQGEMLASKWTRQTTLDFINWMRETPYNGFNNITDSTINRNLIVVRAAFRHCMERPPTIKTIPNVQSRNGRKKPTLSKDQVKELFEYAFASDKRKHLQNYLIVAFTTLARPEAILDLSVDPMREQIEWDYLLLHLNPNGRKQTSKYRPILPINDYLLSILQESTRFYNEQMHKHEQNKNEILKPAGFIVQYKGKSLSRIQSTWNEAKKALGWPMVRDWDAKMIRHTMAKHLRAQRVDWTELKGQMGHKIGDTTEIYAVYDPDYLGQAQAEITRYLDEILCDIPGCARIAPELDKSVISLKAKKSFKHKALA